MFLNRTIVSKNMSKKETSLTEKHETNPFIIELKGKMFLQPRANTIIAKGQSIVDTSTGEIIDESLLIGKRKIVDKSQFAKIYASSIGTLYDLSKTAQNVFLYLTKVMDYDNKAYFSYVNDIKKIGYKSKGTVYNAIKELVNRDIIAPSTMTNVYWLNPTIVCKGERFAIYTEFVVGKDGENNKRLQESELKSQKAINNHLYGEQVSNKIKKSNKINSTDSSNEIIDNKQINLLDQIDELK